MHVAVLKSHHMCVETLIEASADINSTDTTRRTPLHDAADRLVRLWNLSKTDTSQKLPIESDKILLLLAISDPNAVSSYIVVSRYHILYLNLIF